MEVNDTDPSRSVRVPCFMLFRMICFKMSTFTTFINYLAGSLEEVMCTVAPLCLLISKCFYPFN
jgi:hypothetical protein